MPDLIRAGVASLKIEGRLKSPEYVANITRVYRGAIDQAASNSSFYTPQDIYDLRMGFSRGLEQLAGSAGSTTRNWRTEINLRHAAALLRRRVEDVVKRPAQIHRGPRVRIRRNRGFLQDVEPSHLVQPHDVIGVAVGEQDRIDAGDTAGQRLLAKIGCRIDQDRRPDIRLRRESMDAGADRAALSSGRCHTRTQSWGRRATCRCQETLFAPIGHGRMIGLSLFLAST